MLGWLLAVAPAAAGDDFGPPLVPTAGLDGMLPALLRTERPFGEVEAARLAGLGVVVRRTPTGAIRKVGPILPVDGSASALERARAEPWVDRITLAKSGDRRRLPATPTAKLVEADALWQVGPTPAHGATGAGMRIADLDSGIDLFHPHFFRADAGAFAWVDTDGDGVLTPGVDGIDLDGDGDIKARERLKLVDAAAYRFDYLEWSWDLTGDDGVLDTDVDWLYLDENRSGFRDYGAPGFTDADPGLGEPLFVPDDVDGDGVISLDERVIQLGTPVIEAVFAEGRVYERGVDLVDYRPGYRPDHGTAVSGILAGGQLPHQRVRSGLAPDADILFIELGDDATLIEGLGWAADRGAAVILHEWAPWIGYALDGSGPIEEVMDELSASGITQVCPAGNLADTGKHTSLVSSGGGLSVTAEVPGSSPWMILDLHDAAPQGPLDCQLTPPDGTGALPVRFDTTDTEAGADAWMWSSLTTSAGGTLLAEVQLWPSGEELPIGPWTLDCTHQGPDRTFHVYVDDDYGWGRSVVLDHEDPASTMGLPSTASSCISVGAYAGVSADPSVGVGMLRDYSSRGPSWTGHRTIDLTGPDGAVAPMDSEYPFGWYSTFSGTSCAGPHVAAVAALVMQLDPGLSPEGVRALLMDGALVDDAVDVPLPDDGWGAGKVAGYQAWTGLTLGERPAAEPVGISVSGADVDGACVLKGFAAAKTPLARFRWDLDYDGRWDRPWSAASWTAGAYEVGPVVRVQAAVEGWVVGGETLAVDQVECEERRACGCASGEGVGGWLGPALALALIRRPAYSP